MNRVLIIARVCWQELVILVFMLGLLAWGVSLW